MDTKYTFKITLFYLVRIPSDVRNLNFNDTAKMPLCANQEISLRYGSHVLDAGVRDVPVELHASVTCWQKV